MAREWQQSIGREKAIDLYGTNWWEGKTAREICDVQLFTAELCMPFGKFHEAITEALGRDVWIHEFGLNMDGIKDEYLGERQAPTFAEIMAQLPADKTLVVTTSR